MRRTARRRMRSRWARARACFARCRPVTGLPVTEPGPLHPRWAHDPGAHRPSRPKRPGRPTACRAARPPSSLRRRSRALAAPRGHSIQWKPPSLSLSQSTPSSLSEQASGPGQAIALERLPYSRCRQQVDSVRLTGKAAHRGQGPELPAMSYPYGPTSWSGRRVPGAEQIAIRSGLVLLGGRVATRAARSLSSVGRLWRSRSRR